MRNVALLITLALVTLGCGGGEDDGKQAISGTVTWNGAPLPSGNISLVGAAGETDAAVVTDGAFEIRSKPGEKSVVVTAEKKGAMIPASTGVEAGRMPAMESTYQYLPKEFNSKTTLKQTIAADTTSITLDLKGEESPDPQTTKKK